MFGRRRYHNTGYATTAGPRTTAAPVATTTAPRRRRGGLFSGRRAPRRANYDSGYQAGYVAGERHEARRRTSIGDKISGAFMKLQGTLTRRPGLKAAGTRRMHGTDGRGSHRTYY